MQLTDQISKQCDGELEIEIRDANNGQLLHRSREKNIVKIFAKEIMAHRIAHSKIWDPNASTGSGDWVASGIDAAEDFGIKYFLLGASFDDDGAPLDNTDSRYYSQDLVTSAFVPNRLSPGAEYEGELINAIPLAEPSRPLKRIERVYFEPSYQPAGTPLLQDDVRAINNVVVFETVLRKDEYNGFGLTGSDFFTITEIALAGGKEMGTIGACECLPKHLFLEGLNGRAITAVATGTATITIHPDDIAAVNIIKEGDQIKITDVGDTAADTNSTEQVNSNYLVVSKAIDGSDLVLDRTPVDLDNNPLSGSLGVYRNTLRIFSHRILKTPFKKGLDVSVIIRWRIIMG